MAVCGSERGQAFIHVVTLVTTAFCTGVYVRRHCERCQHQLTTPKLWQRCGTLWRVRVINVTLAVCCRMLVGRPGPYLAGIQGIDERGHVVLDVEPMDGINALAANALCLALRLRPVGSLVALAALHMSYNRSGQRCQRLTGRKIPH